MLVGIPTLDLDAAGSDANTGSIHARPHISSSGMADGNETNFHRDMAVENEDSNNNYNDNNNDTLDEVSFASFDFTAGPSAFMTETGYSAPSDIMTTRTQNEY